MKIPHRMDVAAAKIPACQKSLGVPSHVSDVSTALTISTMKHAGKSTRVVLRRRFEVLPDINNKYTTAALKYIARTVSTLEFFKNFRNIYRFQTTNQSEPTCILEITQCVTIAKGNMSELQLKETLQVSYILNQLAT